MMNGTLVEARLKPEWFPDWSGSVCAIVASGASVTREDVEKLKGRCRVAVVNNNHEIAPWADLLYAADGKWWGYYPAARKFCGLKVTPDAPAAKRHGLNLIRLVEETDNDVNQILADAPGLIGRGGNSAFQAVNLVTQFGCKRQIWLGFDFVGEHWHEPHPFPLKNPRPQTLDKWRMRIDAQAETLARLGVEVVNASAISALTNYPKADIDDVLARWGLNEDRQDLGRDGMRDRDAAVRAA